MGGKQNSNSNKKKENPKTIHTPYRKPVILLNMTINTCDKYIKKCDQHATLSQPIPKRKKNIKQAEQHENGLIKL